MTIFRIAFSLLIVLFFAFVYVNFSIFSKATEFAIESHATNQYIGGEPRVESEIKLAIDNKRNLPYKIVIEKIEKSLKSIVSSQLLNGSRLLGDQYYLTSATAPFVFLDVYFDTSEKINYRNNLVYRLRYRWKNPYQFQRFLTGSMRFEDLPIRCEIQAKHRRIEEKNGYSESIESRFEFTKNVEPFSFVDLAPSHWPLAEYIGYSRAGQYAGASLAPASFLAQELLRLGVKGTIDFNPSAVAVTLRSRWHLNVENSWGGGGNPEQVFLISYDRVRYLKNVKLLSKYAMKNRATSRKLGMTTYPLRPEIEIELERNTSQYLVNETKNGAQRTEIFSKDIRLIKSLIEVEMKKAGIGIQPGVESKYQQIIKAMSEGPDEG